MEYTAVKFDNLGELVNEVNRLINQGFTPLGGVSGFQETDRRGNIRTIFVQALTTGGS